ncbi:uncharacterized protein K452DRAFT_228285 [Aplosporella prunicola CBS 121167]|uniref:phosphatidylserine decarboxylase n=1 Tax=Aplosporella prunicola CBS 121167 TaxID=1176127 RepID=A0A6A6BC67_9PEZI|nr:uncharacterized protein K452DRAFT_228285 [Aplosporella prunicola CBS 121167]KAF2141636.1 hypothetical protein K452DRAFT_228285 [Aplosporella prunicola CBS 121167]
MDKLTSHLPASIGHSAGFSAASTALEHITTLAAHHSKAPEETLHQPATHARSHEWLAALFPSAAHLEQLEADHHLGNYVIDRRTGAKSFEAMSIYVRVGMHLLYYGSAQEKALHWARTVKLLEQQSRKMGELYDAPESRDHIQPFVDSFVEVKNGLAELKQPDLTAYPNFNAFFARELKPTARPIDEPSDQLTVSSPADCRLTAYPTVDLATQYWIKGTGFTISRLLGSDELAAQFAGGSLVIARLAPQDYHRWHAPVSGTVESVADIPGAYYTVNPQAINQEGTLDVFCENRRSVMTLRRGASNARVAVVAVGAMLVGSIKYEEGAAVGREVRRGQCLGAFYYGGSTVIVVFPKGEVVLDEDLVRNSTELSCETLMRVGWRVGAGPA